MDSVHVEPVVDQKYPVIELDMTNFMKQLSDECIDSENAEMKDDRVWTNPKITDCKTEDPTDLEEIFSLSGLEQEEKVRKFNMEFDVFHNERFL